MIPQNFKNHLKNGLPQEYNNKKSRGNRFYSEEKGRPDSVVSDSVATGWRVGPKMAASAWKDRGCNLPCGPTISTRHQSTEYLAGSQKQTTAKTKGHLPRFWADFTLDARPLLTWLESLHCLNKKIIFPLVSSKLKYVRAKVRRRKLSSWV